MSSSVDEYSLTDRVRKLQMAYISGSDQSLAIHKTSRLFWNSQPRSDLRKV